MLRNIFVFIKAMFGLLLFLIGAALYIAERSDREVNK